MQQTNCESFMAAPCKAPFITTTEEKLLEEWYQNEQAGEKIKNYSFILLFSQAERGKNNQEMLTVFVPSLTKSS